MKGHGMPLQCGDLIVLVAAYLVYIVGELKQKEIKRLMSAPSIPVSTIAKRCQVSRTTSYKVTPVRRPEPTWQP